MAMALWVARRSPDESTKHGCVVVNPDRTPNSFGFNGFPRGVDDDMMPQTRPDKYKCIIHAEENSFLNSVSDLNGCTMFVSGEPCTQCWAKIIQVGIKRVVIGPVKSKYGNIGVSKDDDRLVALMLKNHEIKIERWKVKDNVIREVNGLHKLLVEVMKGDVEHEG